MVVPTRVGQVYVYDTLKSEQDEYDVVPPRHQDIYDVPPTRQQYNTQVSDSEAQPVIAQETSPPVKPVLNGWF